MASVTKLFINLLNTRNLRSVCNDLVWLSIAICNLDLELIIFNVSSLMAIL